MSFSQVALKSLAFDYYFTRASVKLTLMVSISTAHVDKLFHLPSGVKLPTSKNGSRDRSCQRSWFREFGFLNHETKSEALFFHMCRRYRNVSILLEKNRKAKSKKQNTDIKGANLSKIHLRS